MASVAVDQIAGLQSAVAVKGPVRVATTANISLVGLQTIDTVALAEGDRVLVKNQTDATTNGLYIASALAWSRAADLGSSNDAVKGTRVNVTDGATNVGDWQVTTANPITLGISNLTWASYIPVSSAFATVDVQTHNAIAKSPMVNADEIGFWDSVSLALRKITFANLKASIQAATDLLYMPFTGGLFTGNVAIGNASPQLTLKANASGTNALLAFTTGANNRWLLFKDSSPESGGNVGSNLEINCYDDSGAFIATPLIINRANGVTTLSYQAAFNQGPVGQFRNQIINGDFDVWQRGTAFTPGSGVINADRWQTIFDGAGSTRAVGRQTHALGQTAVPGNPKYYWQLAQTVAGAGATVNTLSQKIEGVKTLQGRKVTVTAWVNFLNAASIVSVNLTQNFGSGGSPSGAVGTVFIGATAILANTWTKIQGVATLPSITGKTLGTNGDDNLQIDFFLPLNSANTFSVSHVSVVEGDATQETDCFAPRHIGQELDLCQRYYMTYGGQALFEKPSNGQCTSTTNVRLNFLFPVQMRAPPSLAFSAAADWSVTNATGAAIAGTAITLDTAETYGVAINITVAAGLVAGNSSLLQASNTLSARLNFNCDL